MRLKYYLAVVFFCFSELGLAASLAAQNQRDYRHESRARLAPLSSQAADPTRATPIQLAGGSRLTLISPERWSEVANRLSTALQKQHDYFSDLFGQIPPLKVTLLLMPDREFYQTTGAPSWTSALFYRGRIIIPLSDAIGADTDNLLRSVSHEYTHAVLHALSGGLCPGWIDEGLAQWAEGSEHPALGPALSRWLRLNQPIPLALLQSGFTKLNPQVVPAAYAQSYFATGLLLSEYGFEILGRYLKLLRQQHAPAQAFEQAFGLTESSFEKMLQQQLQLWQERNHSRTGQIARVAEQFAG